MYKDFENKDVVFEPILMQNHFKKDNPREKVNVGPLMHALEYIGDDCSNPIEKLYQTVRVCLQIIGTADTKSCFIPNEGFKKDLMWDLFTLEEALSRCTEVKL